MRKVQCIAKEDIKEQEWTYEILRIKRGEIFEAIYTEGDPYVTVVGHGFQDGVEFIGLHQAELVNKTKDQII